MHNNSKTIHVYFIPGLATGKNIFKNIKFSTNTISIHILEWLIPETQNESIQLYAQRMSKGISHQNVVLVGISFGGILAQEISKIIKLKKVIIISSIKHKSEMPKRLRWILKSHIYKFFPSKTISKLNKESKIFITKSLKKKANIFETFFEVRDEKYLNWAIFNVLNWNQNDFLDNTVHIHGNKDGIFPIKHINNCIVIKGGTHEMIVTKSKLINYILQEEILNNENSTN